MARLARLLLLAAALAGAAAILRLLLEWTRSQRPAPDQQKGDAAGPEPARPAAPAAPSREELYRQAAALNIRGRSKMNKRQLADAIAAAQAGDGDGGESL